MSGWIRNPDHDIFIDRDAGALYSPPDVEDKTKKKKSGLHSQADFETFNAHRQYALGLNMGSSNRRLGAHSNTPNERSRPTDHTFFPGKTLIQSEPRKTTVYNTIIPGKTLVQSEPRKTSIPSKPPHGSFPVRQTNKRNFSESNVPAAGQPSHSKKRGIKAVEDSLMMSNIRDSQSSSTSNSNVENFRKLRDARREKASAPYTSPQLAHTTSYRQSERQQLLRKSDRLSLQENQQHHQQHYTSPQQPTQRPRTSRKKKVQQKETEVIELLDDSSDSDDDSKCGSNITRQQDHKQQLAQTVNAKLSKSIQAANFGELETLLLKEVWVGDERFAVAESPRKRGRGRPATHSLCASTLNDSSGVDTMVNASSEKLKPCSVIVNMAKSVFKFSLPLSNASASPVGIKEEIAFKNISSIRYSRVVCSSECFASLELKDAALEGFSHIKLSSFSNSTKEASEQSPTTSSAPRREEQVTTVAFAAESTSESSIESRNPVYALLVFPSDEGLLAFDNTFNESPDMHKKRTPLDLVTYLNDVGSDDVRVYETCMLPCFYDQYIGLATKLGVPDRKVYKKPQKLRSSTRRSAQAKYKDKDAGKTLFCFPNDEFAQNTITFCKSDYIRLTDGEFLNDNVIDLQMKRSVLRLGRRVQEQSDPTTTPSVTTSASASSSSSPCRELDQRQQEETSQQQVFEQQDNPSAPVEEVKINAAASPHNTSPVYAFSCMFYTKLTENWERVTRKNMAEAHRVVSRWTKHVDIFEKDFLFFPINIGAHWSLACVVRPGLPFLDRSKHHSGNSDTNYPCILFMDSLDLHDRTKICNSLACYLTQEWSCKKSSEPPRDFLEKRNFPCIDMSKMVPAQLNTYDCGMYLTKYAEEVCQRYPTSTLEDIVNKFTRWFNPKMFSPEDVEQERLRITKFCDNQTKMWTELQAARKAKRAEAKEDGKTDEKTCRDDNCPDDDSKEESEAQDERDELVTGGGDEVTEKKTPAMQLSLDLFNRVANRSSGHASDSATGPGIDTLIGCGVVDGNNEGLVSENQSVEPSTKVMASSEETRVSEGCSSVPQAETSTSSNSSHDRHDNEGAISSTIFPEDTSPSSLKMKGTPVSTTRNVVPSNCRGVGKAACGKGMVDTRMSDMLDADFCDTNEAKEEKSGDDDSDVVVL